jgi:hypothetical protein
MKYTILLYAHYTPTPAFTMYMHMNEEHQITTIMDYFEYDADL